LDWAATRRGADDPPRRTEPQSRIASLVGRVGQNGRKATLRSDRGGPQREELGREVANPDVASTRSARISNGERSAPRVTAVIPSSPGNGYRFEQLADLDAKSLALVMHHSDPKLLLLSMAGADRGLFDRMKRELPASELRQLQRRLAEIRPWRLSDLDAAQQVVAQTADRLALRGLIPLPPAQRLEAGV
jgi:hypothetical protein